MKLPSELVLASGSPRRREIVGALRTRLKVLPVEVDETFLPGEEPDQTAWRLALAKAEAAAQQEPEALVLGADTVVVLRGCSLGKPRDEAEALSMLRRLRGQEHEVVSGIAILDQRDRRGYVTACTTRVWMRGMTDAEVEAYVASGDPLDKAGAYAIQSQQFRPVQRIEGCYLNVVGLPLCHTVRGLRDVGYSLDLSLPAVQAGCPASCPFWTDSLPDRHGAWPVRPPSSDSRSVRKVIKPEAPRDLVVIGLTGNIACGKSTVLTMLEDLGAEVIDADTVAHGLLLAGRPTCGVVVDAFGSSVVGAGGDVDRARLAEIVFRDPAALTRLEAILHPAVDHEIGEWLEGLRTGDEVEPGGSMPCVAVVDAVKLLQSPLESRCDQVWVVVCRREQQIERLVNGRHMSEAAARERLAAQPTVASHLRRADVVIDNGGSLEETRAQVTAAWETLATRA